MCFRDDRSARPRTSSLETDLWASLEAGHIALMLAQAHAAQDGREIPVQWGDIHVFERRRYMDAALIAWRSLNLDAVRFAETQAGLAAFEELDRFCSLHGVDWRDLDHPINTDDALECAIYRCAARAVKRWCDVLAGIYPGLSEHLRRLDQIRTTDTDPALIEESFNR